LISNFQFQISNKRFDPADLNQQPRIAFANFNSNAEGTTSSHRTGRTEIKWGASEISKLELQPSDGSRVSRTRFEN